MNEPSEPRPDPARRFAEFFGLKRNLVVLLVAIFVIGLYDAIRTLLGALYAYPGGVLVDLWGHRRAFLAFNIVSIVGYALVLLIPHWGAVIAGMFLFLSWSCFSLPPPFSLFGAAWEQNPIP